MDTDYYKSNPLLKKIDIFLEGLEGEDLMLEELYSKIENDENYEIETEFVLSELKNLANRISDLKKEI